MSEIEFLDPVPDELDAAADAVPPARRFAVPSGLTVVVPVLWFAAAGLTVAASFGKVYGVLLEQDGQRSRHGLDAWGRYLGGGTDLAGAHGTRYGIPLIAFAVALLVAGVVALSSLVGPERRGAQFGAIMGVLGLGGCAAVTASLYLDGAAARDTVAAEQRTIPNDDPINSFREHISTGSAVWFGIAATACALVALVAVPVVRRLAASSEESPQGGPDSGTSATESVEGDVLSWPNGAG